MTKKYERLDMCLGKVVGGNRSGAYILLDNGEPAFAYNFSSLSRGTEVLCSICRLATEDRNTVVSVDSVLEYAA